MKQKTIIKFLSCVFFFCLLQAGVFGDTTEPTLNPTPSSTSIPTPDPVQEPSPTTTTAVSYQIVGDVNMNNKIDIIYALFIAQYYVGMNPDNFNSGRTDMNSNDKIDIIDALLAAQYYVGMITAF
jgi:hypothetical protein